MSKIAVLLPDSEPFSPIEGGALARWVNEVYNHLDHEYTVYAPKTRAPYDDDRLKILPNLRGINNNNFFGKFTHHLKYNLYPGLAAILCRLTKVDVVHVLNRPSHVLVVKKINPKTKVLLHMQNDHMSSLPIDLFNRVVKESDVIISCSTFIQDKILKRSLINIENKCCVIYNGANTADFTPTFKFSGERKKIVFAGRLVPEKGIKELILAVSPILKKNKSVQLYIVGNNNFGDNSETAYIKELKCLASSYKDQIIFTGFLNHDSLAKLYSESYLFVCPSIWDEPFGMVITEAMANGLPIITSNKGGIPEVIGDSGISVDPEKTQLFTEIMERVINDEKLAEKMAREGYNRLMENFTWKELAKNFSKHLS